MITLKQIAWSNVPVLEPKRDQSLEDDLRKRFGFVPDAVQYLTSVPWTARALVELMRYHPVNVPPNLSHIMSLVITQENSCRYCYGSTRAAMRLLGYSEAYIQRLEQDVHRLDERSDAEKAVVDFARRMARANPLPTFAEVRDLRSHGFSQAVVAEIVFLSGLRSSFGSRLFTPLAVPPSDLEKVAGNWLAKWLSAGRFQKVFQKDSNGAGPQWEGSEETYPFAEFVKTLKDNPAAAGALQRTLASAWESKVTDRRLKGLIFVIVGFSLSSESVVAEATRLLAKEGLDERVVGTVTTHLASKDLTELEVETILFARETVHYKPEQIQEKSKKFRERVTEELLVEILALAALANMVSRIGVLLPKS